jgi:pantothenate kinase type III
MAPPIAWVIDVGNTHAKLLRLHPLSSPLPVAGVAQWPVAQVMEDATPLLAVLQQHGGGERSPLSVGWWCTQPQASAPLQQVLAAAGYRLHPLPREALLRHAQCAPAAAASLGLDRLASVAVFAQRFPQQWGVLLGAGTALTVDVVAPHGQHQGGWLLPSWHQWQHSLPAVIPHLPPAGQWPLVAEEDRAPTVGLGTSTPAALALGHTAVYANGLKAALSQALLALPAFEAGTPCTVLASGGWPAELAALWQAALPSPVSALNAPVQVEPYWPHAAWRLVAPTLP